MSGYSTSLRIVVVETLDGPSADHIHQCEACEQGRVLAVDGHPGNPDASESEEDCSECGGSGEVIVEGCGCAECQREEQNWRREHMTADDRLLAALQQHDVAHDAVEEAEPTGAAHLERLREAERIAVAELLDAARSWREQRERVGGVVHAERTAAP